MRLRAHRVHRLHPTRASLTREVSHGLVDETKRNELRLPLRRIPAHARAGHDRARHGRAALGEHEARHDRQRAGDVHVEGRKHGHRIARQANDRGLAALAPHRRRTHALRAARLLGHVVEARVRAQRQAHDLKGAGRDAARSNHEVRVGGAVQRASKLGRRVTRAQVSDHPATRILHEAAQQDAVRVRNLAALQGLARSLELRTRRDHDDARAR